MTGPTPRSRYADLGRETFDRVVEFVSIVTTPQCASLAIGAIRQVPVVKDGAVTIGERLNVTLSADHRVADGATAAQYLQDLTKLLQAPLSLLI